MPPRRRTQDLLWPSGGELRSTAYQRQPPYTCVQSQNVRTQEVFENRDRGGQRPGLRKAFTTQLGDGEPVRLLNQVRESVSGSKVIYDDFNYLAYPSVWTAATWLDGVPRLSPVSAPTYIGTFGLDVSMGIVYSAVSDLDTAEAYSLSALLHPSGIGFGSAVGSVYGKYQLFFRMDDSAPDASYDGAIVTLDGDYSGGSHIITVTLTVNVGGSDTNYSLGTFTAGSSSYDVSVTVTVNGDVVSVVVGGTSIGSQDISAHGAAAGTRFGVGLISEKETISSNTNLVAAFIDAFRFAYTSTDDTPSRVWTLAASNATLYRSAKDGASFAGVTGGATLNTAKRLQSVEYLGKLYIADYEDAANLDVSNATISTATLDSASVADWTAVADADDDAVEIVTNSTPGTYYISSVSAGSVTLTSSPGDDTAVRVRVARAPKVWDADTNTLSLWQADSGNMPLECPLITRFMGGIVLAGQKRFPHIAYHSASGDPDDWDTSSTSPTGAYATTTYADVISKPITALIPFRDDYLIYGCTTEIWVQRGSLRLGGSIQNVSRNIGVLSANSWCWTPDGTLVFMSSGGLYTLSPGAFGSPVPLSRNRLPAEFLDIDPEMVQVELAWDERAQGVKIALTTVGQNRTHWFLHWPYGAFWREKYQDDHQPTALFAETQADSAPRLLIGCADGYIREHNAGSVTDDGYDIASWIDYGPLRLGRYDGEGGTLRQLIATLAYDSADVTWQVFIGETGEEVSPPHYEGALIKRTTEDGVTRITEDGEERLLENVALSSGTWTAKLNRPNHIHRRGGAYLLKLAATDGAATAWAIENVMAEVADGGIRKL